MKRKRVFKVLITIFMLLFLLKSTSIADVGDFETYDSGSSWGGSDYSSSSSSRDYDYGRSSWSSREYGGSNNDYYNRNSEKDSKISGILTILVVIIVIAVLATNRKRAQRQYQSYDMTSRDNGTDEKGVINKIKENDLLFNEDEFSSWARDLFIKLQYAWSERDWSQMRCFETKELYEQHLTQLERYKINRQINKIERVSVNSVKYLNFEQTADKDILSIVLNSKMIDYIIDEGTGQVIKGDKNTYNINNYKLTFVRKKGIKTKPGDNKLNVVNCPNCGAPTEITSAGKCPYCGSIISTSEHDWVLSNLERYNY